jgi:molybdate transport system permease protein
VSVGEPYALASDAPSAPAIAHRHVATTARGDRRLVLARTGVGSAAALLMLFLTVPIVALAWRGLRAATSLAPEAAVGLTAAIRLSLCTSSIALLVIVGLGTPLAYLLARASFRGAHVIDALVDLPIVLPPAVAGLALLLAFGRTGVVGRWLNAAGISIGFTPTAVVLAQLFVAAPFFVRAAKAGFTRIDRTLEDAAADLGAPPRTVFRTMTLPLAMPSLIAGAIIAWARALGEFGATIMFAGNLPGVTQTMPLAIYGRFGAGDLPAALALSLVLLGLALALLSAVRLLHRGGRDAARARPSAS